jgi:hypothetical protein
MPILPCSALVSGMFDANDLAAFQGIQIRTPGRGRHRLAGETFRWEEGWGDNHIARRALDPGRGVRGYTFQKLRARSS